MTSHLDLGSDGYRQTQAKMLAKTTRSNSSSGDLSCSTLDLSTAPSQAFTRKVAIAAGGRGGRTRPALSASRTQDSIERLQAAKISASVLIEKYVRFSAD